MALSNAGVHAFLVVSAIARERGYWTCHLVEQGANLRAVVSLSPGQR
jgi:hypothetical protein